MGQGNVDDMRLFFTDEAAAWAKTEKDREESPGHLARECGQGDGVTADADRCRSLAG